MLLSLSHRIRTLIPSIRFPFVKWNILRCMTWNMGHQTYWRTTVHRAHTHSSHSTRDYLFRISISLCCVLLFLSFSLYLPVILIFFSGRHNVRQNKWNPYTAHSHKIASPVICTCGDRWINKRKLSRKKRTGTGRERARARENVCLTSTTMATTTPATAVDGSSVVTLFMFTVHSQSHE